MESPCIGIDLGTTNSCVAAYIDGEVKILPNEHGELTTPSVVYLGSDGIEVGKRAQQMALVHPEKTIYEIKRVIGKTLRQIDQSDIRRWPHKLLENDEGKVVVSVEDRQYTPEQISSMILLTMRKIAERELGAKVECAVVTVPAHFNQSQKLATIDAARIAGLRVLRLLVEPTAAALAHARQNELASKKRVLVYDLGGGTFDASLLVYEGGGGGDDEFIVESIESDAHLGGEDFTHLIVEMAERAFKGEHSRTADPKAMLRLKNVCEDRKRALSDETAVDIEVMNFVEDRDLQVSLTRKKYEKMIEPYAKATVNVVDLCLSAVDMPKEQIDEVVLVGGASRTPLVQAMLAEFFDGKELRRNVDPDAAVAYGAAVLARNMSIGAKTVRDATPLSLGVSALGGRMAVVLPKNSPIPTISPASRTFRNAFAHQTSTSIGVYEGECALVADNHKLGEIVLEFPAGAAGTVVVDATFAIDANGILRVAAKRRGDDDGGASIRVDYESGRLDEDEIRRCREEAEEAVARAEKGRAAQGDLAEYCRELKLRAKTGTIDGRSTTDAMLTAMTTLDWMRGEARTASDLRAKLEELERAFGKLDF